jgi:hypothetical protein
MTILKSNGCIGPVSELVLQRPPSGRMSALPSTADIARTSRNVRVVPEGDIRDRQLAGREEPKYPLTVAEIWYWPHLNPWWPLLNLRVVLFTRPVDHPDNQEDHH